MKATEQGASARYQIRAASKLTGVGIDTLRAWERRYGAVAPARDARARLYSETDLVRLRLLRQAVSAGHSVGRIAALGDEDLRRLAATDATATARAAPPPSRVARTDAAAFADAVATLDTAAIDHEFYRLAAILSPLELLRDVLMPTLAQIGHDCEQRRAGIAHEHMVSSAMRNLLGSFLRLYARRDGPARLLFATPSGDRHEIGILGAAILAANSGLAVSYVGPDLPARDIVEAARSSGARALVLGLTLAAKSKERERELRTLVEDLPPEVELWAGGRAAAHYAGVISPRGLVLPHFDAYQQQLARIGGRVA